MGCQYCGMTHPGGGICPSVKAIEYYPDGKIKRVEMRDLMGAPVAPAQDDRRTSPWPSAFPVTCLAGEAIGGPMRNI